MAKFLITGGAGYIGSHFCDSALERGHQVLCFDNFSTGRKFFIAEAQKNSKFTVVEGDIRDFKQIEYSVRDFSPDWVIHFAANADVRYGLEQPHRDLEYNTVGTWNVLESARQSGVKNFLFSSTGSVYGEPAIFPTPEVCPFPVQTSLYGASKLAGEGIISAYSHGYGINGIVFRFVSILGPRYTHGHVIDFMRKILKDRNQIEVLGNGQQLKSYLHVMDLISGLWQVIDINPVGFHVYNIGHDDALTVDRSIGYIMDELRVNPKLLYTGGERGWVGDSPRIQLDCTKLRKLGWKFKKTLEESVRDTVQYLQENSHLLEERL